MSNPNHRGPRPLADVLGELFTLRGYSSLRTRQELENAWNRALGEPICRQTQLGELRRGVLNVTVAHSTLLEELAAFRKPALMAALRAEAPSSAIHDIRFRVGTVTDRGKPKEATKPSVDLEEDTLKPTNEPRPSHRRGHGGNKRGRGLGHGPAQP